MESFLDALLDEKTPTLFTVFSYISQKNSTKAKEISGSWLTVLYCCIFPLHHTEKRNMFSVEPR